MLNKKETNETDSLSIAEIFHPSAPEEPAEWGAVWAEATLIPATRGSESDKASGHSVRIAEVLVDVANTVPSDFSSRETDDQVGGNSTMQGSTQPDGKLGCPCRFFLDGVIGSSLAIAAIVAVYGMELAASIVYFLAAGFFSVAKKMKEGPLFLIYFILMIVVRVLLLVDALVLIMSVFVSELIGSLAFAVTLAFAGSDLASQWKQYIRKITHLVRCMFRSCHKGWGLERSIGCGHYCDIGHVGNDLKTSPNQTTRTGHV